ncbi:MAG: anhydro-N-acetylmuramic acid kinase [Armatimonadetes bacterium]|nr:anhydro-N-acetylmuramic acid kinase [Armatimonadota bacterium]
MSLHAGIMSGTSLDGVDVAFADIVLEDADPARPRFVVRLVAWGSLPYPDDLRERVQAVRQGHPVPVAEICGLHVDLAEIYADAVAQIAATHGISLSDVTAIGLHGQTVWHAPPSSGRLPPATLQLGQPAVLAERLGVPTVSDFRARDMAAGGEGAPLVPFADYVLLASSDEDRVALNLGGIANVTYLRAGGSLDDLIAFDTGPGNLVMDGLAQSLLGTPHDADGALAAQGLPNEVLLADLLRHPYFALPPPKSTGAELFSAAYAADLCRRGAHLSPADLMATACRLTSDSIARALRDFLPRLPRRLIVSGGGTRNRALLALLAQTLPGIPVDTSDAFGIPLAAKEALAFALLAAAHRHSLPANVPRVTGARGPRLLGSLTLP